MREFGIFYYHLNDEGKLLTLLEKRAPEVIGDGKHTVLELIRKDKILRPNKKYFDKSLFPKVLKKDQVLKLSTIKNIDTGGKYYDLTEKINSELVSTVDSIMSNRGFNYGKLDVMADDEKALEQGDFDIIEINGFESQASSLYDTKYNYFQALKKMNQQYDIMFRIAQENKDREMDRYPLKKHLKSVLSAEKRLNDLKKQTVEFNS